MGERVHVWLKLFHKPEKETLTSVFEHLSFWMNTFQDQSKYRITIYSENIELPRQYFDGCEVVDRKELVEGNEECRELEKRVKTNRILSEKWRDACSALFFPYYNSDAEYVINVDASDIRIQTSAEKALHYVEKALEVVREQNLPQLSWDIYMLPNSQWSMGVNIAHREKMKEVFEKAMKTPTPDGGWGKNVDAMITQLMRTGGYMSGVPVCFTTPEWICHEGDVGQGLCSRFNIDEGKMETSFYGKRMQGGKLHERCVLIS